MESCSSLPPSLSLSTLSFPLHPRNQSLGLAAHICNRSSWEVEEGWGYPVLYIQLHPSLGYTMRLWIRINKSTRTKQLRNQASNQEPSKQATNQPIKNNNPTKPTTSDQITDFWVKSKFIIARWRGSSPCITCSPLSSADLEHCDLSSQWAWVDVGGALWLV